MAWDSATDMQALTVSAAILQLQNNCIALDAGTITIAGVKIFTTSPIVPTPTTDYQTATKKYVDDAAVALTGNQTVAGVKTFNSIPVFSAGISVESRTDDTGCTQTGRIWIRTDL